MDPLLDRLHQTLCAAVERARGGRLDQPVTVAEVYQDLIPYRAVRDPLGLELNADYEHVLLRLLSGEADCVRLEPAEARRELADELDSPNPFVGLYRKFAACDVWVRPARPAPAGPAADGDDLFDTLFDPDPELATAPARESAVAPEPAPEEVPAPREVPATPRPEPNVQPEPVQRPDRNAGGSVNGARPRAAEPHAHALRSAPAASGPAGCTFCDAPLPKGRSVRYCPFCGEDQRRRPCADCGEVLEPGWRFCIGCGAGIAEETEPSGAA